MTIKQTWTADTKSAEAAVNRYAKQVFKVEDRIRALTGKSKTAAQVAEQLGKRQVKSAKDGERQYAALDKRMATATATLNKLGGAEKKKTAASKAAQRVQAEYAAKMRHLNALLKKGTITQEQYGIAAKQAALGAILPMSQANAGMVRTIRNLATMATSYFGISRAISFVAGSAREAQAEVREVVAALEETYEGAKRIWQVSESREAYAGLSAKYKLAMAKEGIARPQAQELAFTLKSFNELAALPQVAATARYTKPEVSAEYLARTRATTAWGKDFATPEQALAGLAMGAKKSGFDIETTAEWFARTASAFSSMGASAEEVLAVGAAVSPAFTKGTMQAVGMRRLESTLSQWRERALAKGEIEEEDVQGLVATFKAFQEKAPEKYAEAVLANVRFKAVATALGKPETLQRVKELTVEIGEEFKTGAEYRRLIGDRPPELSQQQASAVAKAQREIALEPLAEKQRELETVIDRLKTVAAVAGKPLTVEKMWEKASEAGATMGMVTGATEAGRQRLSDVMQKEFPETFRRHILPSFPARYGPGEKVPYATPTQQAYGSWGNFGAERDPTAREKLLRDIPREVTEAQRTALTNAMFEVTREQITTRAGVDPGIFPSAPDPAIADKLDKVSGELNRVVEAVEAGTVATTEAINAAATETRTDRQETKPLTQVAPVTEAPALSY